MQKNPPQPHSKRSRRASPTAAAPNRPRSSIKALPASIAAEVKLERRSEIFTSQTWSEHYPEEGKQARRLSAYDRLANMPASDPASEMLNAMLVNTYESYVDNQRLATIHVDDPRLFAIYSGHAERLSKLCLLQVAALDRHQTRGKQQISVEHVHVAAGGRAIVGNVDVRAPKKRALSGGPHTQSSSE